MSAVGAAPLTSSFQPGGPCGALHGGFRRSRAPIAGPGSQRLLRAGGREWPEAIREAEREPRDRLACILEETDVFALMAFDDHMEDDGLSSTSAFHSDSAQQLDAVPALAPLDSDTAGAERDEWRQSEPSTRALVQDGTSHASWSPCSPPSPAARASSSRDRRFAKAYVPPEPWPFFFSDSQSRKRTSITSISAAATLLPPDVRSADAPTTRGQRRAHDTRRQPDAQRESPSTERKKCPAKARARGVANRLGHTHATRQQPHNAAEHS